MAGPRTEEAAKDGRAEHEETHEQEAGRDDTQLECVHDFVQFQRGERPARDLPVNDVHREQDIDERQRNRAPTGVVAPRFRRS